MNFARQIRFQSGCRDDNAPAGVPSHAIVKLGGSL